MCFLSERQEQKNSLRLFISDKIITHFVLQGAFTSFSSAHARLMTLITVLH